MEFSRKIASIMVMAIVLICMSGYLKYIPTFLASTGRSDEAGANIAATGQGVDDDLLVASAAEKTSTEESAIIEAADVAENNKERTVWEKITALVQRADNSFRHIAFETAFIDLNGGVQRMLDRRIIFDADPVNDVYKLNNGQLAGFNAAPSGIVDECAQAVISLADDLQERGTDFIYLNAPVKVSKYEQQWSYGMTDYINEDMDRFLDIIAQNEIKAVDFRELMAAEGIAQAEMFIPTDHHWSMSAGLWAADRLFAGKLKQYLYHDREIFAPDSYQIDLHENCLGSYGRRVGRWYGGTDDLALFKPKFGTAFSLTVPSLNIAREGEFAKVMYNYDILAEDPYDSYHYYVYIAQEPALTIIKNEQENNGKKCLLIEDSFGRVLSPFLALEFAEVHVWNPRIVSGEMSLRDYIEELDPDLVMVLFYGEQLAERNSGTFKFD